LSPALLLGLPQSPSRMTAEPRRNCKIGRRLSSQLNQRSRSYRTPRYTPLLRRSNRHTTIMPELSTNISSLTTFEATRFQLVLSRAGGSSSLDASPRLRELINHVGSNSSYLPSGRVSTQVPSSRSFPPCGPGRGGCRRCGFVRRVGMLSSFPFEVLNCVFDVGHSMTFLGMVLLQNECR
jgi:hypothetical protein